MGDFNIHLDSQDDFYSAALSSTLEAFDLKQHISSPTHSSGHILDLLITRDKTPVTDFGVSEQSLSDHSAIFCKLPAMVSSPLTRTVKTYRKLSSIDTHAFPLIFLLLHFILTLLQLLRTSRSSFNLCSRLF